MANDGRVLPDFDAVVFDEAHTLEDIATSYFGIEISNSMVKYLLDSIMNPKTGKGLVSRLFHSTNASNHAKQTGIIGDIEKLLKEAHSASDLFFSEIIEEYGTSNKTTRIREKGAIDNYLKKPLSELAEAMESLLDIVKTEEEKLEILAFAGRCSETNRNISTVINHELEECVYWTEIEKRRSRAESLTETLQLANPLKPINHRNTRCSLLAAPINIAEGFQKQIFDKIKPVVLVSATLSINGNFKYIKRRLGIPFSENSQIRISNDNHKQENGDFEKTKDEDYFEKIIGSPFNFNENALIYVPDNIPDPNKEPEKNKRNVIENT